MKKYIAILIMLLSSPTLAGEEAVSHSNPDAYLIGIEYFEQGEFQAASDAFRETIRLSPSPRMAPDEYVPYIYLSASQFEIGNTLEARDALIQSQVHGAAPKTDIGKRLLEQYAADIMSAPLTAPALASAPETAAPETTTDSAIMFPASAEISPAKILKRCANAAKMKELPWYFHYKCGVDLMKAGEAQRAIESFEMGTVAREDSARGKRMYGMWYIDYLPYYQIALAQSQLGDWESARAAMERSTELGEFSPSDPGYNSYLELDQLISKNLDNGES